MHTTEEQSAAWRASLGDLRLYAQVRRIATMIHQQAKDARIPLEDLQKRRPNPEYCRTKHGVVLVTFNGIPAELWTLWGVWKIAAPNLKDSVLWSALLPALIRAFKATLFMPAQTSPAGTIAMYALHRVEDALLPEPAMLPKEAFVPNEQALSTWEIFTAQHYRVHPSP